MKLKREIPYNLNRDTFIVYLSIAVMCLVGNKSDLGDDREVSTEDAMEYASSIGALFCETSALKNTGIHI